MCQWRLGTWKLEVVEIFGDDIGPRYELAANGPFRGDEIRKGALYTGGGRPFVIISAVKMTLVKLCRGVSWWWFVLFVYSVILVLPFAHRD